jgi:hypothetical protein
MLLQKCKTCKVEVHNECYGISGDEVSKRNPHFECWACKAVGTTVKVRERDPKTKERIEYKVTERPTECILCSVDDGKDWMHAMHPIYDDYGLPGRQLVAPATNEKPKRLAWGHTLCCFTICTHPSTSGCVFGCTQDGAYSGDDEDVSNYDDSSINSDLDEDLDDPSDESIHHFVYVLPKNNVQSAWTKCIKAQQELKCSLCGKNDELPTSFSIASKF